jgi:hypothetical protein
VVYTLHPTFPNPVQVMDNRRTGFKLESAGWGEFEIHLQIAHKNGEIRERKHWLKLAYLKGAEGAATRGFEPRRVWQLPIYPAARRMPR